MQMILREELIREILSELENVKIVYLEAPCGWGKTILLHQLEQTLGKSRCRFVHGIDVVRMELMENKNRLQQQGGWTEVLLIDNLGEWLVSGNMDLLLNYIQRGGEQTKFVLAGRMPLPPQLLYYKMMSQVTIYNKKKLQYSQKELGRMCVDNGICEGEQIKELYEICQGMPLFLTVAGGFIKGAVRDD